MNNVNNDKPVDNRSVFQRQNDRDKKNGTGPAVYNQATDTWVQPQPERGPGSPAHGHKVAGQFVQAVDKLLGAK